MGKYHIVFETVAQKQITQHYRSGNRATIKKLTTILNELSVNPENGTGNPEQLNIVYLGFGLDELIKKID